MVLSEVFQALGDETRLKILNLLTKRELCVCLIEEVLGIAQPNVSKHLNKLRKIGLITCRKIEQWCFFRISDILIKQYCSLFDFLINQWKTNQHYIQDIQKLEFLLQTNNCCKKLLEKAKQDALI